jgi:hypothetical protein
VAGENMHDRVVEVLDDWISELDKDDERDAITARVLQVTRQVLREHDGALGAVGAEEPGRCKGCREGWPCPTLRKLHEVYVEDKFPPDLNTTLDCDFDGCPGGVRFDAGTTKWADTHIETGARFDGHSEDCPRRGWLRDPAVERVIGLDVVLPSGSVN